MDIVQLSALELGKKIKDKEIGVAEATEAVLNKAEETKDSNAYITICREDALLKAKKVQVLINEGKLSSPLAGVPMAVKDNMCTEGIETTCASLTLKGFKPIFSSTAVKKLQDSGSILLGKLNMDEFAMGNTSETSYYGETKNPWNDKKVSGGSSSGSAVAVALDSAFFTLGSDTGGSIRQPCSFCGVTGIKPTYGTVSRRGVIAYASSLDQVGPIGKNVEDVAEVLSLISGNDPMDSTSFNKGSMKFNLNGDIKGKKIGIPLDYFGAGIEVSVRESVYAAAKVLESLGAIIEEFSLPEVQYAIPTYYIISCAEASSNLSRFDGIKYGYSSPKFDDLTDLYFKSRSEGFGMEVKRRIMLGSFVLSSGYYDAYYNKALQVKAIIKKSFDMAFEKYDAILSPVAPTTALDSGKNLSDPLKMYLGDIYTVSVNLAGLPAMSLPCGFDNEGMPIGLQLIGNAFNEQEILNIGYAFQQETDYHKKKPVFLKERSGM